MPQSQVIGRFIIFCNVATLYFGELNIDPKESKMADRDKFVLSKGHAVSYALCSTREEGFYEVSEMMTLRQVGSKFQGHPNMNKGSGIECRQARSDRDFLLR